jgi:hypothetical protein
MNLKPPWKFSPTSGGLLLFKDFLSPDSSSEESNREALLS